MSEFENPVEIRPELLASVEALLFVTAEPVSPSQLAVVLEISTQEVDDLLASLHEKYQMSGFRLQWHAGKVQLTTAPEKSEIIERFLGLESSTKLSRAALETLAIIAYRQPVTRPNLESVRGVSSDGVLRSLLNKGLIQEIGRSEGPGRPILYGTTSDFLQYFGLNSLDNLPAIPNNELTTGENTLKE